MAEQDNVQGSDLGLEISMNLSMETIAKVSGDICLELLRQSRELAAGDESNAPPSLESIAFHAHRLAWICCTGQFPSEGGE